MGGAAMEETDTMTYAAGEGKKTQAMPVPAAAPQSDSEEPMSPPDVEQSTSQVDTQNCSIGRDTSSDTVDEQAYQPVGGTSRTVSLVWEDLSASVWRDAIYSDAAKSNCMGVLFEKQTALFSGLLHKLKAGYEAVALVEVGSGTAELFTKVHTDCDMCIGIDVNEKMNEFALRMHPQFEGSNVHLITGDAMNLGEEISSKVYPQGHPFWQPGTARVTCMCMNTLGILPDAIRNECLRKMFLTSGPGGMMVLGCWRRESMRVGFEQFYSAYPSLCGPVTEDDFDFETGDLNAPSGYTSHWWTSQELGEMLAGAFPWDRRNLDLTFSVQGVGIFAICNVFPECKDGGTLTAEPRHTQPAGRHP